jgi:inner membrane protein
MDNVCHTLVGLALAESGLARRSARGTLTLAAAANLPDVDALVYLLGDGVTALAVRRGWTHGVLAMLVLPVLLAGAVWSWDRGAHLRAVRRNALAAANGGPPADLGALFVLSVVGVLSHTLFDWLNSYGVRLLMPLADGWFYGDALFVVDPWLWLALGAGVLVARLRRRAAARGSVRGPLGAVRGRRDVAFETRPARVALAVAAAYVLVMVASAAVAARLAERAARAAGAPAARRVMAGPVVLTPFRREVVRDLGDAYELATFEWLPTPRYSAPERVPSGAATPAATAAARTPDGAAFLTWSRFPIFAAAPGVPNRVRITDARYARGPRAAWAAVDVDIP